MTRSTDFHKHYWPTYLLTYQGTFRNTYGVNNLRLLMNKMIHCIGKQNNFHLTLWCPDIKHCNDTTSTITIELQSSRHLFTHLHHHHHHLRNQTLINHPRYHIHLHIVSSRRMLEYQTEIRKDVLNNHIQMISLINHNPRPMSMQL